MATNDAIAEAAAIILAESGMDHLTVARVARRAHVSSALVHYHFATKKRLLEVVARRQARQRTERRVAALGSGSALRALDALWSAVASGSGAVAERVCLDLALSGRGEGGAAGREVRAALAGERERELELLGRALPRVLAGLGAAPRLSADDLAAVVSTFLDGTAAALAAGGVAGVVRASFDAFWLALAGPGQSPASL